MLINFIDYFQRNRFDLLYHLSIFNFHDFCLIFIISFLLLSDTNLVPLLTHNSFGDFIQCPRLPEDSSCQLVGTEVILGFSESERCFSCGSAGKEFACSVGDVGLIPGLRRSLGERKHSPLQYSGLENSMGSTGAESQTRLTDFYFHFVSSRKLSASWPPIPLSLALESSFLHLCQLAFSQAFGETPLQTP